VLSLSFSVGVAGAMALLFGVSPALQLSRTSARQVLAASTRRVMGGVHERRTYSALIAVQIALTLVLLAGAGSATTGFLRMIRTPLGYDPHHVMSAGIPLRMNSFETWAARGDLSRAIEGQGGGDARRDDGGDLEQRHAAAERLVFACSRFWGSARRSSRGRRW
jgi:hypothetical protein